MSCDFSHLPPSCASAQGTMYTLSKAVSEIKLSPKLVCSSLWNKLRELLCAANSRGRDPEHFIKSIMKVSVFPERLKNTIFWKLHSITGEKNHPTTSFNNYWKITVSGVLSQTLGGCNLSNSSSFPILSKLLWIMVYLPISVFHYIYTPFLPFVCLRLPIYLRQWLALTKGSNRCSRERYFSTAQCYCYVKTQQSLVNLVQ